MGELCIFILYLEFVLKYKYFKLHLNQSKRTDIYNKGRKEVKKTVSPEDTG